MQHTVMLLRMWVGLLAPAAGLVVAFACGSSKPAPKLAEEASDKSWEPDGGAKDAPAPKEEASAGDGPSLPELKLRDARLIEASVDYTGAVLIIGEARLIFPENAVGKGTVVHFGLGTQKGPGRLGKSYEFAPELSSAGDPFVLELPLPRGRESANFAISRTEAKGGNERLVWDVVAATRIDEERRMAVLELSELRECWVHLTTQSP